MQRLAMQRWVCKRWCHMLLAITDVATDKLISALWGHRS